VATLKWCCSAMAAMKDLDIGGFTLDGRILIFDEPTRGIDVGAKEETYELLEQLCGQGKAILMISSELPEALRMNHRIAVVTHGRITGLKLHILMNHADQCPVAHSITDARVNDVDERHIMQPEKGATYVFDKGYCDYNWWAKLDEAGAYFVTRLKTNAAVETIQRFLGRSANAVKLQILCAMIAYLLLKLYRQSGRMGESLHLLCARIAGSLFERPQTPYAHYARRRRERLEPARMQGVLF